MADPPPRITAGRGWQRYGHSLGRVLPTKLNEARALSRKTLGLFSSKRPTKR